jgi:hypothetical protein
MSIFVKADNLNNVKIDINSLPDTCPICNTVIAPHILYTYVLQNDNHNITLSHSFFGCPKCSKTFCVTYRISEYTSNRGVYSSYPIHTLPYPENKMPISESIEKSFPVAMDLFRQAEKAENFELSDLSGMGYRKALEFLIKDALIELNIEGRENVVKLTLCQAIDKCADAPKLRKAAHAARDLGNDFAHYEQRCDADDISALKSLLKQTFYWLDAELENHKFEPTASKESE